MNRHIMSICSQHPLPSSQSLFSSHVPLPYPLCACLQLDSGSDDGMGAADDEEEQEEVEAEIRLIPEDPAKGEVLR